MIKNMATVRMTEAEVVKNIAMVLEKVRQGLNVVVEQRNHQPVAIISTPKQSGRPISECIASAEASGSKAILDANFSRDLEEIIAQNQEPWNPPSWD